MNKIRNTAETLKNEDHRHAVHLGGTLGFAIGPHPLTTSPLWVLTLPKHSRDLVSFQGITHIPPMHGHAFKRLDLEFHVLPRPFELNSLPSGRANTVFAERPEGI